MHVTFIQFCGVWSVALGCYALLCLVIPRLKRRISPVLAIIGACFCFLLGLAAFGIGRPYTFIAAFPIWAIGYVVERCRSKPSGVSFERDDT